MDCSIVSSELRHTVPYIYSGGTPILPPNSFNERPQLSSVSHKVRQDWNFRRKYFPASRSASGSSFRRQCVSTLSDSRRSPSDVDWETLGFGLVQTDNMYVMKCHQGGTFSEGRVEPLHNIELSPSAGILNYGQGVFEGLKAYRKHDGTVSLFRPEENALRMMAGARRMCMPVLPVDRFVGAVRAVVAANMRWVPPFGKGSLYVRPILMGTGPVLGLAPSPEYTFLIYVSPVGNYFKEGLHPIHLLVQTETHRAARGGTGAVKAVGNYASVLKAQCEAKEQGFSDVLFLDSVHNTYLEEVSSSNIFLVKSKEKVIFTPALDGTVLPGVTRGTVIQISRSLGYTVKERQVAVDVLREVDEVFCTGTAVVVSPVGSVTHEGQKLAFHQEGVSVTQQIYKLLTDIQMGIVEDKSNWLVHVN